MVISKDSKTQAKVLVILENYKGLNTPLITAVTRCQDKHLLVEAMLKENGLSNVVEPRDDKTFTVTTMKGVRVISYLDAFFNGKKLIKYIKRQDNINGD